MIETRATERLRQEREAFDQLKAHCRWWFTLRLCTGFVAIAVLLAVLIIAARVVLSPSEYNQETVTLAAVSMLADLLTLAGTAFKFVLQHDTATQLRPTIGTDGRTHPRPK